MNDEKVNYVIEMIKDMDLENKLRLAICMCDDYRVKKNCINILIIC